MLNSVKVRFFLVKKILLVTVLILFAGGGSYAQSIINTLGTDGVYIIKDSTKTLFSLKQSDAVIRIHPQYPGDIGGSVFKGTDRFLHSYQGSGTVGWNTFLGFNSGNFSMGGSIESGSYNTGIGAMSLFSNTTGSYNTACGQRSLGANTLGYKNSAFGYRSLSSNTTGKENSAFGNRSLEFNTTGNENSAFGSLSLYKNTTGSFNSSFGIYSLLNNTTGNRNSAFGYSSLYYNTTGAYNSSFGIQSLYYNTQGSNNSSFGYLSLFNNTSGYNNSSFGNISSMQNTTGYNNSAFGHGSLTDNTTGTENSSFGNNSLQNNREGNWNSSFGYLSLYGSNGNSNSAFGTQSLYGNINGNNNSAFGVLAGSLSATGSNNTMIGFDAQVPSYSGSNQVRIGNTAITYAGIQVAWTVTSDRNLKSNILSSDLGLGFISRLRPVSYTRINDESGKTEYGLIAQEVEETLKEEGAENPGMLTVTNSGEYQLRYNDLIAPMIKAIQELKSEKDTEISMLKHENDELKKKIESFKSVEERLVMLEKYMLDNYTPEHNNVKEVNSETGSCGNQ